MNSCRYCGKCCTEKTVSLTEEDIVRISARSSFLFYTIKQTTGARVLKWNKSKEKYICVFFNPSTRQCNIYEDRPLICKEFFCIK